MTRHQLHHDGVDLAYEQAGEGPLVVLVQGLGLPGSMWRGLTVRLVEEGFTVVTPDTRGTGRSAEPPPPYTMGALTGDLAAVIAQVDRGAALVVGLSLGGMIAQHLALRHPALVRGLVLASTSCGLLMGKLPNMRFLGVLAGCVAGKARSMERMHRILVHPESLERNPDLMKFGEQQLRATPIKWKGVLGQLSAAAGHGTYYSLPRIHCPTAVIAGADDQVVPAANARILARRIPGATLPVVERAGHIFPVEYPEVLPAAIHELSDCPSDELQRKG